MNQFLVLNFVAILGFSQFAFAVAVPGYETNVVMTCGETTILSNEYTTRQRGYLAASNLDNEIIAESKNRADRVTLIKTEEAESSWWGFGEKEGVGLYESEDFILDLRKSSIQKEIYLEDKATGQKIECRVHGDCC